MLNWLMALTLVMGIAVAAMWARSYWYLYYIVVDKVSAPPDAQHDRVRLFRIALASGSLGITWWTTDWAKDSSNPAQYLSHPPPPYRLPIGIDWTLGVPNDWGKVAIGHYHAITTKERYVTTTAESWAIPIWPIDGVLLGLATIWLFAVYRKWRSPQDGCCAECGYDLRASPERCPECGTIPPKKETVSS
jgi:hypothetical protein